MTDDKKPKSKRRTSRRRAKTAKVPLALTEPVAPEPAPEPSAAATRADTMPAPPSPEPAVSRDDEPTLRTSLADPVAPAARPTEGYLLYHEQVFAAVYEGALDGGASPREAQNIADAVCDRLRLDGEPSQASWTSPSFYDLRDEQDYVYPRGANKVRKRGGSVVMRDPSAIDTIIVHQTGCEFGVSKRAIATAGGDVELARARRALDVACHVLAFRNGYFVAAHPLLAYVNHAGRDNAPSLCLEIEGRYPGIADKPHTMAREDLNTTWGGEPTTLTSQTVGASIAALSWMIQKARALGCPIAKIKTHRQSSDTRRSDPGEEIFKRVVLVVAELFDLEVVYESLSRHGRPVPVEWDAENGIGSY